MAKARYMEKRGNTYWWIPPKSARSVFKLENLGTDQSAAIRKANDLNLVYDRWKQSGEQSNEGTVGYLFEKFQGSIPWRHKLSESTRKTYIKCIGYTSQAVIHNIAFKEYPVADVSRSVVTELYQYLISHHGIDMANLCYAMCRRAWNVCMNEYDLAVTNPFVGRELERKDRDKIVWTKEQYELLCRAADDCGHPEVSLAAGLAYWFGQRPVDVLNLRWEDYKDGRMLIRQQKTKRAYYISTPMFVRNMLDKAPRLSEYVISKANGKPYDRGEFSQVFAKVRSLAGLPDELKFSKFRATAATELADCGATEDEIMAVGGWVSRQVVSEYVQRTNRQADNAMNKRMKNHE